MALIDAQDLHFSYPGATAPALRGVRFSLAPSETVILLGPNGSGKSTFSLHLNGILHASAGALSVCGLPMNAANLSAIRSKVGLVFQHPDEQLFMPTVLEDVCFGPLNQGLSAGEARSRARAALDQVGASRLEDRPPYHLSFGEKRRVALAGVLAMRPEVLVLDEPTTYLDPPGQRQLAALLSELPQAKVIVTHDLNLARRLGARADFFRDGQIAASGGVEAIIRQFDWEW